MFKCSQLKLLRAECLHILLLIIIIYLLENEYMARLEKISSNSWKQPFADRKKQFNLWGSHTDVADLCRLEDSTKRLLSIQFEKRPDLNVVDRFQITSGREISFPKSFQELIKPVITKRHP